MDKADPSTTSGVLASSKDEAPRDQDSQIGSGRLEVRCPNCHTPMEVAVDTLLTDLTCSVCGSHFSLVDQSQATRMAPPLSTMGRFELVERLGVGGFGSVWKARDRELDRTVAIKIPRQGGMTAEQQEKFFREARAAAQLRHSNIVSVHEVGRDGESVYIVSDFVRGVTLGDWLTGQKLTSREAAELCAKIADALDHAHEQGVVHRDLKPANIMIDGAGEPHLMDFGLARRDAGEVTVTLDGEVLGTPAYMSPEQALGESHTADRRSDVYSLGVILFQLVTGELPFRGNARMIMHQVIHDEPPSPRKLNANVTDDLETITIKCLEKEPERRYSTARDLADDLRRFLAGEPIYARPTSRTERAVRWVRRNPVVSALSAAVVVALVTGTVVSAYFAKDALRKAALALAREQEANLARREAEERQNEAEQSRAAEAQSRANAEAVSDFLVKAFASPDPARDGRTITVAEVLDRTEKQLEQELSDQPLTQAALLDAIGLSRLGLGLSREAIGPLTKAKDLHLERLGAGHRDTLGSTYNLAVALRAAGRYEEAIAVHQKVLQSQSRVLGPDHHDTLASKYALASAYTSAGRADEAISLLEQSIDAMRKSLVGDHPHTLAAMHNLALAYNHAGRRKEAIQLYEQTLTAMREKLGPHHPHTLNAIQNLGTAYYYDGQRDKGMRLLDKAFTARREALGADHPQTLDLAVYLATGFRRAKEWDQAVQVLEENLAERRERLGSDHPDTLKLIKNLASAYQTAFRFDKAIPLNEEAMAGLRETRGPGDPATIQAMNDLAGTYYAAGRWDKSIPLQEEALNSMRKLGTNRAETMRMANNLAIMYAGQGKLDKAIPLFEEAFRVRLQELGNQHTDTRTSMNDLARAYQSADRLDDAVRVYEQLIQEPISKLAEDDPTLQSMHDLAHSLADSRNYAAAIRMFQVTRDCRVAKLGELHEHTLEWTNCLAEALTSSGRQQEAIPSLETIVRGRREKLRLGDPVMLSSVKNLVSAYRAAGRVERPTQSVKQLLEDGHFFEVLQVAGNDLVKEMIAVAMTIRHRGEKMPRPIDAVVLGELRLVGGDAKSAEAAIRAALARTPASFMHKSLGWCLLAQGRSDEAKQAFEESLKPLRRKGGTFDLDKADHVQLTSAYFLDLVSEKQYVAHTSGNKELACFPWFYVGQRREIEGNKEAAVAAYERGVELGDDETAHSNRALARWRLAKLRESTEK